MSAFYPLSGNKLENQAIVKSNTNSQDQSFQIYHGGEIDSIQVNEYDSLQDILNAMENGDVDKSVGILLDLSKLESK